MMRCLWCGRVRGMDGPATRGPCPRPWVLSCTPSAPRARRHLTLSFLLYSRPLVLRAAASCVPLQRQAADGTPAAAELMSPQTCPGSLCLARGRGEGRVCSVGQHWASAVGGEGPVVPRPRQLGLPRCPCPHSRAAGLGYPSPRGQGWERTRGLVRCSSSLPVV